LESLRVISIQNGEQSIPQLLESVLVCSNVKRWIIRSWVNISYKNSREVLIVWWNPWGISKSQAENENSLEVPRDFSFFCLPFEDSSGISSNYQDFSGILVEKVDLGSNFLWKHLKRDLWDLYTLTWTRRKNERGHGSIHFWQSYILSKKILV
jgi:hypothetical protein